MSAVNFTVIQSPFTNGTPAPQDPTKFAEAVLKALSGRLPSPVALEHFLSPEEADPDWQCRDSSEHPKHTRDLKTSISACGLREGIIGQAFTDENGNKKVVIIEGNHRFNAVTELFEEDPNWMPTTTGSPEISVFVLEEGFFPSDAHRLAFQLYMNRPSLKRSCSPDEVIRATGELISANFFGNVATAGAGIIEDGAKSFVKEQYPTMSRRQVADAVVARANSIRNKRRLTKGFTAKSARDFKGASRPVFDGKERGDYVISPMVISNDNADFRKAVGEIVDKLAVLSANGGANGLAEKVRLVAKTNKPTDTDIDSYRAKIRAKVADINVYATAAMGSSLIDELLFLPEKTNESKERRLKRFV